MIPNGKEMNWKGHKLRFESEPSSCCGCFFADKNECPDCDDGAWVEDSPWYTGTPTEEGWYVCKMNGDPMPEYDTDYFNGFSWRYYCAECIVRWQKIEEKEDGIQTDL